VANARLSVATLRPVLREIISWPISAARTAVDLPRAVERSIREANELMDASREQLDVMRRQADEALEQAERMNELLGRVVRLTEPIERAQRGGEYAAERLKRAIFGPEEAAARASIDAEVIAEEAAVVEQGEVVEQQEASARPPDPPER
jgi:hypothetical protein